MHKGKAETDIAVFDDPLPCTQNKFNKWVSSSVWHWALKKCDDFLIPVWFITACTFMRQEALGQDWKLVNMHKLERTLDRFPRIYSFKCLHISANFLGIGLYK